MSRARALEVLLARLAGAPARCGARRGPRPEDAQPAAGASTSRRSRPLSSPQPARMLRAPGTAPAAAPRAKVREGLGPAGSSRTAWERSCAAPRRGQLSEARQGSPARWAREWWLWGFLPFFFSWCSLFFFPAFLAHCPRSRRSSCARYKVPGINNKGNTQRFLHSTAHLAGPAPSPGGGTGAAPAGARRREEPGPAGRSALPGARNTGTGRQFWLSGCEGWRAPRLLCALLKRHHKLSRGNGRLLLWSPTIFRSRA